MTVKSIVTIRHGEKPTGKYNGVDQYGNLNPDGLIPQGWERAGGLVGLFSPPAHTTPVARPQALVAPLYPTDVHRPHLTLVPLSQLTGIQIACTYAVDADPKTVATALTAIDAECVLVCWEHEHLVGIVDALAQILQVTNPGDVPTSWPDDRFDVIWRFDRDDTTGQWSFACANQELLAGDVFS